MVVGPQTLTQHVCSSIVASTNCKATSTRVHGIVWNRQNRPCINNASTKLKIVLQPYFYLLQ